MPMSTPLAQGGVAFCVALLAGFPHAVLAQPIPTLAPMIERVSPAVVNISVSGSVGVTNPLFDDPFFRQFFPPQPSERPFQSAGSGVIVNADEGLILTNHHVIENADDITVTLLDDRSADAMVIGSDEASDLAVLKIDLDGLAEIKVGDSSALRVGDYVVAIGNPFGFSHTVTSGIVSGLGRSGINPAANAYEDFIQTDASINPGNSGGALVDLDGRLVGINTAIVSPGGGNVGIGFAVPVHMAKEVTAQLIEYGEVRRGRLGVYIQDVTPGLADALELKVTQGAVVTQVEPGSAAETAGLEVGDVITALDGSPILGASALRNKVGLLPVGRDVGISVVREDGSRQLTAKIGDAPAEAAANAPAQTVDELEGAQLRSLDASDSRDGNRSGVLVASVEPGSPAARNGLLEGDVITAVNRTPVASVAELRTAVRAATGAIALDVRRENARLFIVIQ
jgi:serine protease DegQ